MSRNRRQDVNILWWGLVLVSFWLFLSVVVVEFRMTSNSISNAELSNTLNTVKLQNIENVREKKSNQKPEQNLRKVQLEETDEFKVKDVQKEQLQHPLPINPGAKVEIVLTEEEKRSRKKQNEQNQSDEARFDELVLEFQNSKSKTNINGSDERCKAFRENSGTKFGPIAPSDWSDAEDEALINALSMDHPEIREHLANFGATIMSNKHKLCSPHPLPFGDPVALDDSPAKTPAYVFKDVCVTFNIDSNKQAQRSVLLFDPENKSNERCVPCPNPQMQKQWGLNDCGIMWFHQNNVQENFEEYNTCYQQNSKRIKGAGQRQAQGEKLVQGAIYYPGTTLNVQYVRFNPGHQLWDNLLSIAPLLQMMELADDLHLFSKAFVQQKPDCPDSVWFCAMLRALGVFELVPVLPNAPKVVKENIIPVFDNVASCFEELIVPISGWDHSNNAVPGKTLRWFRRALFHAFDLEEDESHDKVKNILLYAHDSHGVEGVRRSWTNMRDLVDDIDSFNDKKAVVVDDFALLTPKEQARMFFDADYIIMPHGGQFGNSIFIRPGTIVVEISCNRYSHMATNDFYFAKSLSFSHVVYAPCECEQAHHLDSNFSLRWQEVKALMKVLDKGEVFHNVVSARSYNLCN